MKPLNIGFNNYVIDERIISIGNLTLEAPVTEVALHQAVAQATTEGYDLLYLKGRYLGARVAQLTDGCWPMKRLFTPKSFRPFPIPHQR